MFLGAIAVVGNVLKLGIKQAVHAQAQALQKLLLQRKSEKNELALQLETPGSVQPAPGAIAKNTIGPGTKLQYVLSCH